MRSVVAVLSVALYVCFLKGSVESTETFNVPILRQLENETKTQKPPSEEIHFPTRTTPVVSTVSVQIVTDLPKVSTAKVDANDKNSPKSRRMNENSKLTTLVTKPNQKHSKPLIKSSKKKITPKDTTLSTKVSPESTTKSLLKKDFILTATKEKKTPKNSENKTQSGSDNNFTKEISTPEIQARRSENHEKEKEKSKIDKADIFLQPAEDKIDNVRKSTNIESDGFLVTEKSDEDVVLVNSRRSNANLENVKDEVKEIGLQRRTPKTSYDLITKLLEREEPPYVPVYGTTYSPPNSLHYTSSLNQFSGSLAAGQNDPIYQPEDINSLLKRASFESIVQQSQLKPDRFETYVYRPRLGAARYRSLALEARNNQYSKLFKQQSPSPLSHRYPQFFARSYPAFVKPFHVPISNPNHQNLRSEDPIFYRTSIQLNNLYPRQPMQVPYGINAVG